MSSDEAHRGAPQPERIVRDVPIAPLTTLELGGSADFLVEAERPAEAIDAVRWARARGLPLVVLAGGSNLVVADDGWPGLVIRVAMRGIEMERHGNEVLVTASAGEPWNAFVEAMVEENLAGIECLAGIPGTVGATPIQNVGAYGQEVATTIEMVRALDLETLEILAFRTAHCGFGYRRSVFRENPGRYLVVSVTYRLAAGARGTVAYAELRKALGKSAAAAPLTDVYTTVLELRRAKSMVIEDDNPNRRSVGSFFVNPVLGARELAELSNRARSAGFEDLPFHPVGENHFKVPAAWLIEHAGFAKGRHHKSVGISDDHALALVHHGGGTSAELLDFARQIRHEVLVKFEIELQPEPVFVGFPTANPLSAGQSTE
jgi:UDP-N-acetylmuramate dehydrogenase